jgi:5-formyltetrahydrofolate cyclo-ligase
MMIVGTASVPPVRFFPPMRTTFARKPDARTTVWDTLETEGVARFPFPPHGRIPNFENAKTAAKRLFQSPLFAEADCIKVNPDAPQRYVRIEALRRGCVVYVPTPRLRGGFRRLDPSAIPPDDLSSAASLSNMDPWAASVSLDDLPPLDAIVTGSVAVTRDGRRCGKGEGYSDLEYALLRELGHDPVPVATTVHPLQIVDAFPTDRHDLPLSLIVTPDETITVDEPSAPPDGIDWAALSDDDLDEMPVLRTLRNRT